MSYANRPMGDYKTYGYAGDPGWLSSIWKAVKKPVLRIAGGLIGGPIGTAIAVGTTVGAVVGAAKPRGPAIAPPPRFDRRRRVVPRRHNGIGRGRTSLTCRGRSARSGRVSPGQGNPLEVGA